MYRDNRKIRLKVFVNYTEQPLEILYYHSDYTKILWKEIQNKNNATSVMLL